MSGICPFTVRVMTRKVGPVKMRRGCASRDHKVPEDAVRSAGLSVEQSLEFVGVVVLLVHAVRPRVILDGDGGGPRVPECSSVER